MRPLIVPMALAAGSLTLVDAPASAHNDHGTPSGYATCQEQRTSEWTSESYTTHSHLSFVHPDWAYIEWHCCLDLFGLSHRYNHSARWWNGATSSRAWSPVYGGFCP
jgi:hypothetical protein